MDNKDLFEMDYREQNYWLSFYGLHVAHEDDDGNETWQLGSSGNEKWEPQCFTREDALKYAQKRHNA